jgi:2-phosphoglycerate kinase
MIYLIGGSPRSGKTSLAKKMAFKLNCKLISVDDVRNEEIKLLDDKEAIKKFPFAMVYKNNDDFFQKYTSEEVLAWEIKDAKAIWSKMEKIIDDNIKNKSQVVIEGVQLLPEFLEKYNKNSSVIIWFLYKKDKKLILEGFHKNKKDDDWLVNETKDQITFIKAADAFSLYGEFFERETQRRNFKSINTEYNFEKIIDNLIEVIK